jgi:hypothetical protein
LGMACIHGTCCEQKLTFWLAFNGNAAIATEPT